MVFSPATEPSVSVAVVPLCPSSADRVIVEQLVRRLQSHQLDVAILPIERPFGPCPATVGEVEALLASARQWFENLDFEQAQKGLERVLATRLLPHALAEVLETLVRAHFYLAWMHTEKGRVERARRHFRTLTLLAPDWEPPADLFPPHIAAALASEREAFMAAQQFELTITSTPSGAAVTLDDKTCTTPCKLPGRRAGRHLVTVSLAGHRAQWGWHQLSSRRAQIDITLLPDPRDGLSRAFESGSHDHLFARVTALRSDVAVLLLERATSESRAAVVVAPGSRQVRTGLVLVESGEAEDPLVAAVLEVLRPTGPLDPTPPEPAPRVADRWWLWTGIGVGAFAAIVLGVVLVGPGNDLVPQP